MRVAIFLFGILLIGLPRPVQGCICNEPPPYEEAMRTSDRVFLGTVVETEVVAKPGDDSGDFAIKRHLLQVDRYWKGTDRSWLIADTIGGDCSYLFAGRGTQYLVFAADLDNESRVFVSQCLPTTTQFVDALDAFGAGQIATPSPRPSIALPSRELGNEEQATKSRTIRFWVVALGALAVFSVVVVVVRKTTPGEHDGVG